MLKRKKQKLSLLIQTPATALTKLNWTQHHSCKEIAMKRPDNLLVLRRLSVPQLRVLIQDLTINKSKKSNKRLEITTSF